MKKIPVFIILVIVFAACNNSNTNKMGGWTKESENKFMNDCLNSSGNNPQKKQICSCVLEKLEKKYATSMDADARGNRQEGQELAQECMNGGNTNNNNNNLMPGLVIYICTVNTSQGLQVVGVICLMDYYHVLYYLL